MKNLLILTSLISLFSLSGLRKAQASEGVAVYGSLTAQFGAPVFTSLEDDTFGESVEVSKKSIDARFNCSEGLFTLTQGQSSQGGFDIVDVVCDELAEF